MWYMTLFELWFSQGVCPVGGLLSRMVVLFLQTTVFKIDRDFPGGPVVKTLPSNARGVGSIPGWEAKIPHASLPKNQNTQKK